MILGLIRLLHSRGVVACVLLGIIAHKLPAHWLLSVGCLTTGLADVLYAIVEVNTSYFAYNFWSQILGPIGVDVGKCFAGLRAQHVPSRLISNARRREAAVVGYIYVTRMVSETEVAATASTLQFFKVLGVVCGASFSTLVYTGIARKHGSRKDELFSEGKRDELLLGLRAAFWFWAAMSFFGRCRGFCHRAQGEGVALLTLRFIL